MEQTAKVYYYVSQLGSGVEITREQADTLRSMIGFYQKLTAAAVMARVPLGRRGQSQ